MPLVTGNARQKQASGPLDRTFYSQSGLDLAAALPGTILVRRLGRHVRRARIVDVEDYLGPKDLASHSSKGRTARTEVMFGPPRHTYVYFIYGMQWMFNVVAGVEGGAQSRSSALGVWQRGGRHLRCDPDHRRHRRSFDRNSGGDWLAVARFRPPSKGNEKKGDQVTATSVSNGHDPATKQMESTGRKV